jgi:hypothetical protein
MFYIASCQTSSSIGVVLGLIFRACRVPPAALSRLARKGLCASPAKMLKWSKGAGSGVLRTVVSLCMLRHVVFVFDNFAKMLTAAIGGAESHSSQAEGSQRICIVTEPAPTDFADDLPTHIILGSRYEGLAVVCPSGVLADMQEGARCFPEHPHRKLDHAAAVGAKLLPLPTRPPYNGGSSCVATVAAAGASDCGTERAELLVLQIVPNSRTLAAGAEATISRRQFVLADGHSDGY